MPPDVERRTQLILMNLHKLEDLCLLTQQDEWANYTDHPHLSALIWLYSRPWFERLWVVQEVNAIPDITVLCGKVSISWDRLGLAAAFIPTTWFDIEGIESIFHGSFIKNADKMRHRSALQTWSLYTIMSYTSEYRTTNPRDQIYGKLGLRAFNQVANSMRIQPDYTRPVQEVFMDFAISGINYFHNLDVLSFAEPKDTPQNDFSSWVPLWDENLVMRTVLVQFGSWNWRAHGGARLKIPISVLDGSIYLKGLVLDRILRIIDVDPEGWRPNCAKNRRNSLYQLWQQECQNGGPEFDNSSHIEDSRFLAFAASIVAGVQYPAQRITDNWASFQNEVTSYLRLSTLEETERAYVALAEAEEAWFQYRIRAHTCTAGRVLFETSSGYVGLGPQLLRTGDLACVLYGGKVPFILRPAGKHYSFFGGTYQDPLGGKYYSFIGESYIHGYMEGEAITMLQDGKLKEQEFEIR